MQYPVADLEFYRRVCRTKKILIQFDNTIYEIYKQLQIRKIIIHTSTKQYDKS